MRIILSMNKQTQDLIKVVTELFPNFKSSQIQEKKGSNNGIPFLIQDGEKKYWLKLVNSSKMEDSLKDVEKQALQEVKSPNVIELIDVKTKVINGQRFDGLLFIFIEGEDLASIFATKKALLSFPLFSVTKKIIERCCLRNQGNVFKGVGSSRY